MDQFAKKWMYAKDQPPLLVTSAEQLAALGEGWFENPGLTVETPVEVDAAGEPIRAIDATPKVEYQKYLYDKDGQVRKVSDEDARLALGPGWYESPDEAKAASAPVTPPVPDAELVSMAPQADQVKPKKRG